VPAIPAGDPANELGEPPVLDTSGRCVAEAVRFELTDGFHRRQFSRLLP